MDRKIFNLVLPALLFAACQIANTAPIYQRTSTPAPGMEHSTSRTDQPDTSVIPTHNAVLPSRDVVSARIRWSLGDVDAIISQAVLSRDGNWAALGYNLNTPRFVLVNTDDGSASITHLCSDDLGGLAVSADGRFSVAASGDSLWIFDLRKGEIPLFAYDLSEGNAGPVAITADGRTVFATSSSLESEFNSVWCFRDGSKAWKLSVDAESSFGWYGINLCADESTLVVNGKYRFFVVDALTGKLLFEEPTYNTESSIAISGDGSVLAVASLSGKLRVMLKDDAMEPPKWREIWRYGFEGGDANWVSACDISEDGRWIAAGSLDFYEDHYGGRVALFETFRGGQPVWISDSFADEIAAVALAPDGSRLAAASWGDVDNEEDDFAIFERHSNVPVFSVNTFGSLEALDVSGDGMVFLTSGKATHNRVWGRGGQAYLIDLSLSGLIVEGTVKDWSERPIPGALVYSDASPQTAITRSDGSYWLFADIADETNVKISVKAPSFKDGFVFIQNALPGMHGYGVDFALENASVAPTSLRLSGRSATSIDLEWGGSNLHPNNPASPRQTVQTAVSIADSSSSLKDVVGGHLGDFTAGVEFPSSTHSDEIGSVNVYRSLRSGGPYSLVAHLDANVVSYTDSVELFPQIDYYYVVTIEYEDGESALSNEVRASLESDYLDWDLELTHLTIPPTYDGIIDSAEWRGAVVRDISDVLGYDGRDAPGTAEVRIALDDVNKRLCLAFSLFKHPALLDRMGVGVYIDDDGDGEWTYARSGSEGNYWGYWIDGAPDMRYRSLAGPPYQYEPYLGFPDPPLAFSDAAGYVTIEMGIPLGFHTPDEVALYAPDWTFGLGLFSVYKVSEDELAFDSWWPQDMFSIVSHPDQFARVKADIDLPVPPRPPSGLAVSRDDKDLRLSWTDPDSGLDNAPIQRLEFINIYRNNELDYIVHQEVGRWLDNRTLWGGWFEYALSAIVLEQGELLEGPRSEPVGRFAGGDPVLRNIVYDDNVAEARYVVRYEGEDNRWAARFDIEGSGDSLLVYRIDFYPASATPIDIYLVPDSSGIPSSPKSGVYTVQPRVAGAFHSFYFPDIHQPRFILGDGEQRTVWVVLQYREDTPDAPAIGVDFSNLNPQFNLYHTKEDGWQPFSPGQLMVRLAVGGKVPPGSPVDTSTTIPANFALGQNYPNPFNRVTLLPLDLPEAAPVVLQVFDIAGRRVWERRWEELPAGRHRLPVDLTALGSGVYFLRVDTGAEVAFVKAALIK